MQSTRRWEIHDAPFQQAFVGNARVICPMGLVVAVRKPKRPLLAMIKGWSGCWCSVDRVRIEEWGRGHQCFSASLVRRNYWTVQMEFDTDEILWENAFRTCQGKDKTYAAGVE